MVLYDMVSLCGGWSLFASFWHLLWRSEMDWPGKLSARAAVDKVFGRLVRLRHLAGNTFGQPSFLETAGVSCWMLLWPALLSEVAIGILAGGHFMVV